MTNFRFDAAGLAKGLAERELKLKAGLALLGDSTAKKMEAYAKTKRRWQDRTGHATQRLTGTSKPKGNGVRVEIAHGVDYGVYLELCNEKRYAILEETIEKVGPEALKGLNILLK